MSSIFSGTPTINPTMAIKPMDITPIPELNILGEEDFHKYVPTGISVVIDTPLAKNTKNAMFAINVDGFIPGWAFNEDTWPIVMKNLSPIQVFPEAITYCRVFQEMINIPIQTKYMSYRFFTGNVGVGMRITSNTAQSGNLLIAQASGVMRKFYERAEAYNGLMFDNSSNAVTDYSNGAFIVTDLSLNRNLSITTIRHDLVAKTDLAMKLLQVYNYAPPGTLGEALENNVYKSQFLEDWILVTPLSNVPNQNADQITITFFFDYSNINFIEPMFPVITTIPTDFEKQILRWSDSFNGNTTNSKLSALFFPG